MREKGCQLEAEFSASLASFNIPMTTIHSEYYISHPCLYIMSKFTRQIRHIPETPWASVCVIGIWRKVWEVQWKSELVEMLWHTAW